jgi:L-iditol 2-dehydrogenase
MKQNIPSGFMKAACLTGIGRFEVRLAPKPEIVRDTDVLIRLNTVGICGSDIHYYKTGRIGNQIVQFPFIIGHEAAGTVEQTGEKVSRVKPDQRIAIDPAVSCGHCDQCRVGRENTCRELLFLGCPGQLGGALCEYIVLPENCCYPVDQRITFEQATLSEPLAIAVYSVKRSGLSAGARAAILGTGPVGMSVFHVLRTKNAGEVYITDKILSRLEFAQQLQPRWSGNPDCTDIVKGITDIEPDLLDIVYECSGDRQAFHQAIQILKPGGVLVLVGIPEVEEIPFPIHELRRKEITILNIRRQAGCVQEALDLLAQRRINMDLMVTHRFPLEKIGDAFDLVAHYRDGVMKAMVSLDRSLY